MSDELNPLDLWDTELRKGVDGQDRFRPGTWKLDALWRAACYEASARECASEIGVDESRENAWAILAGELFDDAA